MTNETIKNILSRRTCRKFSKDFVPSELIHDVVKCGLAAPSAMNIRPFHLTVVTDTSVLSDISNANQNLMIMSGVERFVERASVKDFSVFYNSPAAVIVSINTNISTYALEDAANVMQNMAIACESLGLGSCYIASFNLLFKTEYKDKFLKKLDVPNGFIPHLALAIGYVDKDFVPLVPEIGANEVNYIK